MNSQPVPIKQKSQRRTFYGYKRENILQQIKSYTMPIINYRIIPTGIARPASLRNKLECLLGRSVFTYGKPHPCFRYLLQKLIFYDAVNSNKRTDCRMIVENENSSGLNDSQLEREVKKIVEEIFGELEKMQNEGVYKFTKQMKREERLEIFAKQMSHFRQRLREKLKEEAIERKVSAYRLGREVDFIDSEEYVDELIDNVDRIETLRESQQIKKFNIFLQRNIHYFGVTLKSSDDQIPSFKMTELIINRPSSQMEPLLLNLTQMIGMRSSETSYHQESVIMIKNIYQQLKNYQINPNGIQVFYEHLHPNHIIFNQVALNVKLSFEPLLLDLFGLKKKPMSLEARIAFSPTPTAFDYFRSLQQIDSGSEINKKDQINNVPLVLDDPFFGNRALYKNKQQEPELASEIEEQKRQLQHMKGRILTGRFLLLSYYILNSVQYGYKPNLTSNHEKITNFRSQLSTMKQSLQNDMSKLSDFMGIQNAFVAGKPFNFGMTELGDFMSIDYDDSLLDINKHVLTRKYFQMRTLIIKQFIRLLVNDKIFGRIFNIKKYIFLYLAISIEVIEQARKLVQVELKQKNQRKKLRKYLDTTLIRLKSDKHHFGYLLTTYQKIILYRNRDPLKDHQAKFARDDELGKKAMAFVEEVSKLMYLLQQKQEKLNRWEEREDLSTDQKQAYSEVLKQVEAAVTGGAEKVRGILNEFIFNELRLKYADGPHRNTDDKTQRQWLNMFTNRLELLTLVHISFSEENFLLYSTLVIPQFHIDETEKKFEMPPNISQELKSEENSLKLVSEIIDSSKLLPRKMVYFATKTSNEELKIYERSLKQ